MLSQQLADILGVSRGSDVEIELLEGDRRVITQPVSAIITGYIDSRRSWNSMP